MPYIACANSEGSGETMRMRSLAWAVDVCLCDKTPFHMGWLIIYYTITDFNFGWHKDLSTRKSDIHQDRKPRWLSRLRVDTSLCQPKLKSVAYGLGEYHFSGLKILMSTEIELRNCFVIWLWVNFLRNISTFPFAINSAKMYF